MPVGKTPVQERPPQLAVPQPRQFDPVDALWSFFTSTKVAVVLILLTLVAAFIGAIFLQAPGWAQANPQSYTSWLVERARPHYGALTDFYSAIGLFDAYSSIWFRSLCSLLIINTVACTLNRIPGIWKSVFQPKVVMGEGFYRNSANSATISAPVRVDAVVAALRKERYQVSQAQEGGSTYVYADRNGWAKLGTMFTHLSIVLFLVGAVTGALFGFSDNEVVIGEGSSYNMVRGYNFQVLLNDFTEEWYIQGMPKDYSSDLSVMENGQEVVRKTIRVNDPLVYRGVKFSQSFYGVAPAVEVKDSQGKLLFSDIVPLFGSNVPGYETSSLWFPPSTNVILSRPKKASGAAAARLEYQIRSGNPAREQGFMDLGKPVRSGDLEITFTGDREYTGLRMSSDPGVIVIWIASSLMLLGMCSSFYLPRRRLWARIRPHGVDMAAFADRAVPIAQELDSLARSLAPEGVRPKRDKRKSSGE